MPRHQAQELRQHSVAISGLIALQVDTSSVVVVVDVAICSCDQP
jgi:hypothetical protein